MRTSFSISVGGAAGDGVASAGETFVRLAARSGLEAYAYNSYQSSIRGGHVLFQAEVGAEKKFCVPDFPDVLIALNQDALEPIETLLTATAGSADPLPETHKPE